MSVQPTHKRSINRRSYARSQTSCTGVIVTARRFAALKKLARILT
jgi:hypothetical protein